MEQIELRVLSSELNTDGEDMVVEGIVNKTGDWSHVLGRAKKFREKINKGVFTRAIESEDRIDFLAEHRQDLLLSSTENGSLELWEDEEGLKMRAKIAPTSYGKDFYTLMKHKMINHMSFGFKVLKDSWRKGTDGIFERSVDEIVLKEVSIVRNPAYPQSAIAARGFEVIEDLEIPAELLEETEKRDIDTEAISSMKSEIVSQILDGIKEMIQTSKDSNEENENENSDNSKKDEESAEKNIEENDKKVDENIIENNEDNSEKQDESSTKETQEVKKEVQETINTDGIFDLLDKYNELQNLK